MAQATRRRAPSSSRKKTSSGGSGRVAAIAQGIGGHGPWWSKVLRWIVFLAVAGVLAGALTFFILYRAIAIPDPNAAFLTQTTKVYYSDGKHEIGTFANQDRESVALSEIPAAMQAAAIAAEDRTFYSNNGIDFKGILRAVRDNTTSGSIQGGGSTITQQYVKILYLTQEQSYTRKVKEAILSIKIHNQLSKKEILEGYLNTIYFGNGAYGVQVAAQTYFGKSASELDYAQSALLATIINSPSYYDPYAEGASTRIQPRFDYVLDGMLKSGAITADEREQYRDKLPSVKKKEISNRFGGTKGYLLDMVKKELVNDLDFTESQVDGGGYKIVTSFDYERQKAAVAAVKANRPDKDELHTALVSIEPGTGAVQALYGGPDFVESPFNWATESTQPGSTFKAFALLAALEDGYGLTTKLDGNSPIKVGQALIENQGDSGGASFGNVSLERATQKSINTAFVDLTLQMGDDNAEAGAAKVLDAAVQAGIPQSIADSIGKVAVTSLGYAPVPPIDMANAYATIAAGGKKADWFVVKSVERNGDSVYEHKGESEQSIPEDVAGDAIKAMRSVVNGGTGSNGRTICPTAGKTGTATAGSGNDQHVSSSWFAGFTPKLATAVMYNRGVGNEDLEGYMIPFYGGTIPAKTFQSYMNPALQGTDCGEFVKAGNIKPKKGTVYKKPPPKCSSSQMLNDAKTKCVPKPTPTPTPTPTSTETAPTPTPTPTCGVLGKPACPPDD